VSGVCNLARPRDVEPGMSTRVLPPGVLIEVFYDGDCPLCMREIAMLRRKDRDARIQFTNIAAPGFDAGVLGTTYEALMTKIQGRLPDGKWIEGVEVFRRLYAAIGFRRLVALTRLPGLAHLLTLGYHLFARHRLRLTGRCADGACPIPAAKAHAGHAPRPAHS
jgi:predicted DCC family thiol-disulfide oxidoreductase YuxK